MVAMSDLWQRVLGILGLAGFVGMFFLAKWDRRHNK